MPAVDSQKIPKHIAIIMDGNGRWAARRNLPRLEGHRKGSDTVEEIVESCRELGVRELTLYAFSQENWYRPSEEVSGLMALLKYFVIQKREKLLKNDIRLLTIGKTDNLPEGVLKELTRTILETRHCSSMILTLALSYGSRDEIVDAANQAMRNAMANEDFSKVITEEEFDRLLYTEGRSPPDLLIRTSGEHRISNFLLWQMAYTELYFSETLWPDFSHDELLKAIAEYQKRERRFGRTTEQIKATA
jgi:undecaprenyl diphosphate synthase